MTPPFLRPPIPWWPIGCLLSSLLVFGCAGQIEPGGGPIDTEPPAIVRTVPDSAAIHVRTPMVELDFSKYVDRLSVQQSIFVSPYAGQLEFDWSGTSVRITFSDSLRRNTTYVVNVGTDVKDLHAGNKMAHGFSLAFATGDSIDRGTIVGRVFDERPDGVMVFAYRLDEIHADTLDPTHTKPDYIQQTGRDGTFELSHLAFGHYRVIAVRDEYRDLVYDRQVDAFGVWRSDIALSDARPDVSGLQFRMTKEDTTKPFLTAARNIGDRTLLIHVSEPLDTASFSSARLSVLDTLTRRLLPLDSWYVDAARPSDFGIITAAPVDSGRAYRVMAAGLLDLARNPIDSVHGAVDFTATNEPDTLRPNVRTAFADSATTVPIDSAITLTFSKRAVPAPMMHAVGLVDSTGHAVPISLAWLGGLTLAASPTRPLLIGAWYQLSVTLDSLRDVAGNRYRDSTFVLHFRTTDYRSTGSLEGIVRTDTSVHAPLWITANTIDQTPPIKRTIRRNGPGPFSIERLPQGKWTLEGFVDVGRSGTYDFGQPFPFKPSAPFGVSSDTVKVRARWGVQGVTLDLR